MTKRKKKSYPRLEALGWDEEEATDIIDLGLARLRQTTSRVESEVKFSRARIRESREQLDAELQEYLEADVG